MYYSTVLLFPQLYIIPTLLSLLHKSWILIRFLLVTHNFTTFVFRFYLTACCLVDRMAITSTTRLTALSPDHSCLFPISPSYSVSAELQFMQLQRLHAIIMFNRCAAAPLRRKCTYKRSLTRNLNSQLIFSYRSADTSIYETKKVVHWRLTYFL